MKIKLKKLDNPDFIEVEGIVDSYIRDLQQKDITSDELSDHEQYLFEAVIEAYYGKDCWAEINKILENL